MNNWYSSYSSNPF